MAEKLEIPRSQLFSVRSMTGHGQGEAPLAGGRLQVEVRSVNHRYAEVRIRLPPELAEHCSYAEELIRKMLVRGRIELSARIEGMTEAPLVIDHARAKMAYGALLELRDAIAPNEPVPLFLLAKVPGLFTTEATLSRDDGRAAVHEAVGAACRDVLAMRRCEGEALALDLATRARRAIELVEGIEARAPLVVDATRRRLVERLEKLSPGNRLEPTRLEQEVALIADRADIAEECTRLRSHFQQFAKLLGVHGEDTLGRRLDFLLQELGREANTIGAKSADLEIALLVVELKAEIERMREQSQNIF